MNWKNLFGFIKQRSRQVVGLYAVILIPMWLMYFLNVTLLFNVWNSFGIVPRTLDIGSMIGIIASWTMHGSIAHLIGNSVVMVQILFLFGLFEQRAYRTILMLIVASGFMTWGLGSPFSIHIGASGLIFSMIGFMIGGAVFAKRWGYLLACIVMSATYWVVLKEGLIPQDGISFAGHFGGVCVGLLLGSQSKNQRQLTPNSYG